VYLGVSYDSQNVRRLLLEPNLKLGLIMGTDCVLLDVGSGILCDLGERDMMVSRSKQCSMLFTENILVLHSVVSNYGWCNS
jgi:hypothetical protein